MYGTIFPPKKYIEPKRMTTYKGVGVCDSGCSHKCLCLQVVYVLLWTFLAGLGSACVCVCVCCHVAQARLWSLLLSMCLWQTWWVLLQSPKHTALKHNLVLSGQITVKKMERTNRERRQKKQANNYTNKNNPIHMALLKKKRQVIKSYTANCVAPL